MGRPSLGLRACKCTMEAPACAASIAAVAISSGVTGNEGDIEGVCTEPVTAQVTMILDMNIPSRDPSAGRPLHAAAGPGGRPG